MGFDDFELRLGDVMRGERATLGKSLLDVQRDLKIKATYISAIENTDPTAFETQGFIAGYVRSYARYLGLDPEWAYERFCAEGKFETAHGMSPAASTGRAAVPVEKPRGNRDPFSDPEAVFIPKSEPFWSRIEPGAIGSILVLVMLISAIGYGGYSVFQAVQRVELAPVEQAPGVGSDIVAIQGDVVTAEAGSDSSGLALPGADALDRLYRPQALDVPVFVARDAPIATLNPQDVGNLAPEIDDPEYAFEPEVAAPDTPVPGVQVLAEDVPEVVLYAVRPSWVRVQAADGTVIFEKILDAGERYVLPKKEDPPVLRAGNAGSVYFAVNGEHYGPAGVGPSVVKNIELSPESLTGTFQVADMEKDGDLARFLAVAQNEETSGN